MQLEQRYSQSYLRALSFLNTSILVLNYFMMDGDAPGAKEEDKRTVFVRGLAFSVGDDELTEAFSAIGPVKHAFTVKKKDSQTKHKGFGFVQFALEEDAVRAIQELGGTRLAGRVLKLESAHKRASFEERKSIKKSANENKKEEEAPKQVKRQFPVEESKKKHNLVKTVAVGGLEPNDIDGAVALAKSLGTVEEIVDPAPSSIVRQYHLEQDGCSGSVILVQYETVKQALHAMKELHGSERRLGPGKKSPSIVLWARQVSGEGKHLKKWRVVVRNIPFNVTEQDLRVAFKDCGALWEVTIPRNADGHSRGFAFVGFTSKADTEKAIARVNATDIAGRTVAVDWAVSKRDYQSKGADTKAAAQVALSSDDDDDDGSEGRIKPGQELEQEEEEAALVDPEKEKSIVNNVLDSILNAEEEVRDDDMTSASDDSSGPSLSDEDSATTSSPSSSDHEEEEEEDDDDDEIKKEEEEEEEIERKEHSAVEELNKKAEQLQRTLTQGKEKKEYHVEPGATVFIRNIPVDATQKTVFLAMKKFGFVQSTRLVLNKSTRKPKGTAFVDFKSVECAEKAAEASRKAKEKTGPPVIIAGMPVEIHIALGGDDIRNLAIQKKQEGTGDRRNIYLSKEGTIAIGSAAWNELSASDKSKRARAMEEAELKLKSPNFSVSATRLNVRNVPKSWNEERLKKLFIDAVKRRATKESPKVVQAKILREKGTEALGPSKGIAFIEFKSHDHSLCALRELNNNPDIWGKDHRPIVEFAIDNVQVLKKREAMLDRQKRKRAEDNGVPGSENKATPSTTKAAAKPTKPGEDPPKSKRKLRMERRSMLKQRQRAMQGKNSTQQEQDESKTKSQRRRELRKRKKETDVLTALASSGVDDTITSSSTKKKKKKSDMDAVEQLAAKRMKAFTTTAASKKKSAAAAPTSKRWFEHDS